MDRKEKNIILIICILILLLVLILLYIINEEPKYNKELYNEIYSEYNEIFEEDNKKENYIVQDINGRNCRVIGKLTIPKLNINSPVINETTDELLKIAPTKYAGPNPNEVGNFCIIGHNYKNDQFFSNLSILEIGDKIILTGNDGNEKKYEVYKKFEVIETDLRAISQETDGQTELTLITCTKNNKYRLIVKCRAV